MKRYIILVGFIIFSVCLFFILRTLFLDMYVSGYVDPITEIGQVMEIIPYWFGLFSAMLVVLSWVGVMIFKRDGQVEAYKGFVYSFRYSLIVAIVTLAVIFHIL